MLNFAVGDELLNYFSLISLTISLKVTSSERKSCSVDGKCSNFSALRTRSNVDFSEFRVRKIRPF